MSKCGEKLASWTLLFALASMLGACGGKDVDEASLPTDSIAVENVSSATTTSSPELSSTHQTSSTITVSSSLPSVIQEKDSTPPSTTQLILKDLSESSVTLTWDSATDNAGVNAYKIERNGQLIATLTSPAQSFTDINLQPYAAYTYSITAVDYSGNNSELSSPFTVRTRGTLSSAAASSLIKIPVVSVDSVAKSSATFSVIASSKARSSVAASKNPSSKAKSSAAASANPSSVAKSSVAASIAPSSKAKSSAAISSKTSSSKVSSSLAISSQSSSAPSSAKASSSKKTSSSSSSSSSSVSSKSAANATVTITWSHPDKRENDQFLELDEIGGYEIRYRKATTSTYTNVVIPGNHTTEYTHPNADGEEFEIAVFDSKGVYSSFVKVTP